MFFFKLAFKLTAHYSFLLNEKKYVNEYKNCPIMSVSGSNYTENNSGQKHMLSWHYNLYVLKVSEITDCIITSKLFKHNNNHNHHHHWSYVNVKCYIISFFLSVCSQSVIRNAYVIINFLIFHFLA